VTESHWSIRSVLPIWVHSWRQHDWPKTERETDQARTINRLVNQSSIQHTLYTSTQLDMSAHLK